MAERFEVFKDSKGEYRFRLIAPNNEIIAVSEGYTTKDSCMEGIEAVRNYAPDAPVRDLTV